MRTPISALVVLLTALVTSSAVFGDEPETKVRVALLDVSAVAGMAGTQSGGYGRRGQGMMGPGMMGQDMMGYGMMGPGMMGGGMMGGGMMGGGMMGHGMMSMRIDQSTAKAGTVVFDVTNWSRSVVHEMIVVSVDSPNAPLPYDYNSWRVPEGQIKVLGESGELTPSASHTVSLKLGPGNYLLICNVQGHFAAGMATAFTVTP